MMVRFVWIVGVWLAFACVAQAQQGKRIALLIGNKDYHLTDLNLKNPHNDVKRLAEALKLIGFQVKIVRNANLGKIYRETRAYTSRLRRAGKDAIGFFYYSGHGALDQVTRTNYLIPVDIKNTSTASLWDNSIPLDEITNTLKKGARNAAHFVIFDACRNELQLKRPGSKSLFQSKGFVGVGTIPRMLISYATAEGKIATDEGEGLGHYARILSEELVKPGVEVVSMFRNVQLRVSAEYWSRTLGNIECLASAIILAGKQNDGGGGSDPSRLPRIWAKVSKQIKG